MGFVMNGLNAEPYDRTYPTRVLVTRIARYFRPYMGIVAAAGVNLTLVAITQAALPIIIARGIDFFTGTPSLQLLFALTGLVLVFVSFDWSLNFVRQTLTTKVVGNVVLALRQDASAAVMRHDLSFFDQHAVGRIVSRVISDTQGFTMVVTLTLELFSQLLLITIILGWLLTTNVQLAGITLVVAPLIILAALSFRRAARWTSQRRQRANATLNTALQQTITGIAIARISAGKPGSIMSSRRQIVSPTG